MRFNSAGKSVVALVLLVGVFAVRAQSATAVLQSGYDANVSNANLAETTLNTSNVNVNTFGRLYNLAVDDKVYAQPLYVPGVTLPGLGTHNLLIVATMNDTLYAFDADGPGVALWSLNLAGLFSTTAVPWGQFQLNAPPNPNNLGILSTPVIDPSTKILYVVACTLENGAMAYRLHAIDITTGSEPYGAGVLISASYAGMTFNAHYQTQRVSLALSGNQVVFGFGAMENEAAGNYAGWVMAYNKLTLQQTGAFATVTFGNGGGGLWQSGRPPAVDSAGNVYVFTGNAWGFGYDGVNNFSESVLKFDVSNGLKLVDWFTPSNWSQMDFQDHDLSSSGPMLIAGTSLLAGGGKTGDLYVLNTTNLGKFVVNDTQVVQKQNITGGQIIRGGPAYWNRSTANGGPLFYNWGVNDALKAFSFNGSTLSTSPSATGTTIATIPGGILAVSANGDQPGSGIVWGAHVDTSLGGSPGILRAYDAANITHELWNSEMYPSRDAFGHFAKHVSPVVSNGKVYLATWSNKVAVYGLGAPTPLFSVAPTTLALGNNIVGTSSATQTVTVTNSGSVALQVKGVTVAGTSATQFTQVNTCGTSLAGGASCSIVVVFMPSAVGLQTAWLNVNLGTGAGTRTVSLSGVGVAASFSVAPASLGFGSVPAGMQSAPQEVAVTNNGSIALPLTAIAFSGAGADQFSQTNNCGAPLPGGVQCTINVLFAPTAAGAQAAVLNVSGGGALHSVTVSGTGVVPFSASPTSLAFGSVTTATNSAPLTVTVTNNGSAPLSVTGITLSGANASQFSQTNTCGAQVARGATCTVNVVFSPTATGNQVASLSIAAAGGTVVVALGGIGANATTVSYSLSPASVAFGNVTANTSSMPLPVTVTNTGGATLTISGVTFSGGLPGNFAQSNTCGSPVPPGLTCTINVTLVPTVSGYLFSNLYVVAVGVSAAQSVNVNGTGTVPYIAAPTSLQFGSVPVNTLSQPQVVTVTNTGSVAMPPPTIAFGNAGASQYSQTNTCGAAVPVGASCSVAVTFRPTATGTQAAILKLRSPGVAVNVSLSGAGS